MKAGVAADRMRRSSSATALSKALGMTLAALLATAASAQAADTGSAAPSAAAGPAASAPAAKASEPAAPDSATSAAPADAAASEAAAGPAARALPAGVAATVEQPRAFGHVIGDVLTQRVLLEQAGRSLEPAALPPADRVGLWLDRRAARIEPDAEGGRWLVLDYQLINAPRALMSVSLPALSMATDAGIRLAVPAWPISIGPLTPEAVFGQGELQPLRPDRTVAPLPTAALQRQFAAALGALGALLLAWLGWWAWRNAREAERLPFARAWQELRRLQRRHRGEPLAAVPQAWLALHRALNATAGRVVHSAGLPQLLAEAPQLRPLAVRLDGFYRQSAGRFFAGAPAAAPFDLLELCRELRQAELRHAR